jgi:RES domain-containing protein
VLEYTVNVNIEDIPRALSMTTLDIPDKDILQLTIADLPGNWRASPAPASTKDFGTEVLKKSQFAVIQIPSTVIPDEFNYLLNPLHRDSYQFLILDTQDFIYDVRIKTK